MAQVARNAGSLGLQAADIVGHLGDVGETLQEQARGFASLEVIASEVSVDAQLEDWHTMIDTNVTALITMTHHPLPTLIKRKGAIINISSVTGTCPYMGGNVCGATKSIVAQFSLGLRSDLHGILGTAGA